MLDLLLAVLEALVRLVARRHHHRLVVAEEAVEHLLRLDAHVVHRVLKLTQLVAPPATKYMHTQTATCIYHILHAKM